MKADVKSLNFRYTIFDEIIWISKHMNIINDRIFKILLTGVRVLFHERRKKF